MARTDRLFEIIQILRSARGPLRADDIAATLEVSVRTIYRDIAALQAMRTPIEGAAGVGYVMRRGYDLPPMNFDVEEAEALTLGLSMLARTGDAGLQAAAARAARKLAEAAPMGAALLSSDWGAPPPEADLGAIRRAIREQVRLSFTYRSLSDEETVRTVRPLALVYYAEVILLAGWCEMRDDFRQFRVDRMQAATRGAPFEGAVGLRATWEASRDARVSFDPLSG